MGYGLCLLSLAALGVGGWRVLAWPFPTLSEMRVSPGHAVETAAFLGLGMRRLAADLKMIRLLQYYGSPDPEHEHSHAHGGAEYGKGQYREIHPRTLEILDLDPYFRFAALYSAGSLAFNLDRLDEAVSLLQYALERDPGEWRYASYIAAIGFHRKGRPADVLRVLGPIVDQPDCPTQLQHMVAYLYRRQGNRREAVRIYRRIVQDSKDLNYVELARRELSELAAEMRRKRR